MNRVNPRLRDHVGETCCPVPDLGRHHTGIGLHFLNCIDVEIGKRRAAHLGIGGVEAIRGENRGHAALPVHRKLLREICSAVGVGHRSRRQQQQLAEVARIEWQARYLRTGKVLASSALRRGLAARRNHTHFLSLRGKL